MPPVYFSLIIEWSKYQTDCTHYRTRTEATAALREYATCFFDEDISQLTADEISAKPENECEEHARVYVVGAH